MDAEEYRRRELIPWPPDPEEEARRARAFQHNERTLALLAGKYVVMPETERRWRVSLRLPTRLGMWRLTQRKLARAGKHLEAQGFKVKIDAQRVGPKIDLRLDARRGPEPWDDGPTGVREPRRPHPDLPTLYEARSEDPS